MRSPRRLCPNGMHEIVLGGYAIDAVGERTMTMAIMRRDRGALWPEPFDRSPFDWPLHPFEGFRRMLEDDQFKVEEYTEDGQLVVRAELPGVDPDKDVDISIVDGNLCIRAERRHEEKIEQR